ncbi:MAG: hypothetical protein HY738_09705 [Bacteroidia bacterium]|nr:hypothetical protein [Bacteroidia bacterium]
MKGRKIEIQTDEKKARNANSGLMQAGSNEQFDSFVFQFTFVTWDTDEFQNARLT